MHVNFFVGKKRHKITKGIEATKIEFLLYNNYLVTSRKYAVLKNVEENKLK
jgi:hypothetical protein